MSEVVKPHNGTIRNWYRAHFDKAETENYYKEDVGLGYMIRGKFLDHPYYAGQFGHTSWVMSFDEETGEIETRNSRYTLELTSEMKE
jgi:hypothetical protein